MSYLNEDLKSYCRFNTSQQDLGDVTRTEGPEGRNSYVDILCNIEKNATGYLFCKCENFCKDG